MRRLWPTLEPKINQTCFYIPEAIYWDIVFKFNVDVALNALSNINFEFYKIPKTLFFAKFQGVWLITEQQSAESVSIPGPNKH